MKNYFLQLIKTEYAAFTKQQLLKTPREIFDNAYSILFYTTLYNMFFDCFSEKQSDDLLAAMFKYCATIKPDVLGVLYQEFLSCDFVMDFTSYDCMTEFINDFIEYHTYNKSGIIDFDIYGQKVKLVFGTMTDLKTVTDDELSELSTTIDDVLTQKVKLDSQRTYWFIDNRFYKV